MGNLPKSLVMQGGNKFAAVDVPVGLYGDQGHAYRLLYASGRKKKNIFQKLGEKVSDFNKKAQNRYNSIFGKNSKAQQFYNKKFAPIAIPAAVAITTAGIGAAFGNDLKGLVGGGDKAAAAAAEQPLTGSAGLQTMQDILSGPLPGALAGSDSLINNLTEGTPQETPGGPQPPEKKDDTMTLIWMAAAIFAAIMIFKK